MDNGGALDTLLSLLLSNRVSNSSVARFQLEIWGRIGQRHDQLSPGKHGFSVKKWTFGTPNVKLETSDRADNLQSIRIRVDCDNCVTCAPMTCVSEAAQRPKCHENFVVFDLLGPHGLQTSAGLQSHLLKVYKHHNQSGLFL